MSKDAKGNIIGRLQTHRDKEPKYYKNSAAQIHARGYTCDAYGIFRDREGTYMGLACTLTESQAEERLAAMRSVMEDL